MGVLNVKRCKKYFFFAILFSKKYLYMQNIIISTITGGISPTITAITTISTSIYNLIGHIKLTKNTHHL